MVAASGYIRLQPLLHTVAGRHRAAALLHRGRARRHARRSGGRGGGGILTRLLTCSTPTYYTPTCLLLLTLLLLTILLTMPRWRRRGARSTSGGRRRRTACSLTKPTITHSSPSFIPVAQPPARPRLVSPSRLPTAGPLGSAAEQRPLGPRSAAPGRSLWRRSRRRLRCIVDRSGQSRGRRQRSSPPPRRRSRRAPPAATSYASAPTPRRRP